MRLAWHVECVRRGEVHTGFWWETPGNIHHLGDVDVQYVSLGHIYP